MTLASSSLTSSADPPCRVFLAALTTTPLLLSDFPVHTEPPMVTECPPTVVTLAVPHFLLWNTDLLTLKLPSTDPAALTSPSLH